MLSDLQVAGLLLGLLFFGCRSAPDESVDVLAERAELDESDDSNVSGDSKPKSRQTWGPVIQTGVASRYADSLAGRPTASGEPYDPDAMTCAHKKFPFGTKLHIKVLRTGAEANCTVNDRGPYAKGRILDMSRAVAEEAGVDGIAKVELRKLQPPSR
jgi:rare lipoprotein A